MRRRRFPGAQEEGMHTRTRSRSVAAVGVIGIEKTERAKAAPLYLPLPSLPNGLLTERTYWGGSSSTSTARGGGGSDGGGGSGSVWGREREGGKGACQLGPRRATSRATPEFSPSLTGIARHGRATLTLLRARRTPKRSVSGDLPPQLLHYPSPQRASGSPL